jgi:hypothetical protein
MSAIVAAADELKRCSNGFSEARSSEVWARWNTTQCDKPRYTKDFFSGAAVWRAVGNCSEELNWNYESGGQEFKSLRARQQFQVIVGDGSLETLLETGEVLRAPKRKTLFRRFDQRQ